MKYRRKNKKTEKYEIDNSEAEKSETEDNDHLEDRNGVLQITPIFLTKVTTFNYKHPAITTCTVHRLQESSFKEQNRPW